MPELRISIGDRSYTVACQAGEEVHLQSAAGLLDAEAKAVQKAAPNVSETQLLMMAGLMLADKMTADAAGQQGGISDTEIADLREKLLSSEQKVAELSKSQNGGADTAAMEKLAAKLESLADEMEAAAK